MTELPRWAKIANRAVLWYLFAALALPTVGACLVLILAPHALLDLDAGSFLLVLIAGEVLLGVRLWKGRRRDRPSELK